MLELGHAQVGDGDEVRCGAKAPRGAFGLLQQSVHSLDECIGAVVCHAAHDGIDALGRGRLLR